MSGLPGRFPCTSCGECCRRVGAIKARGMWFPYEVRADGGCEKLGDDGRCTVYEKRPLICNIGRMGRMGGLNEAEWFRVNALACNAMIEEAGLGEAFRVTTGVQEMNLVEERWTDSEDGFSAAEHRLVAELRALPDFTRMLVYRASQQATEDMVVERSFGKAIKVRGRTITASFIRKSHPAYIEAPGLDHAEIRRNEKGLALLSHPYHLSMGQVTSMVEFATKHGVKFSIDGASAYFPGRTMMVAWTHNDNLGVQE